MEGTLKKEYIQVKPKILTWKPTWEIFWPWEPEKQKNDYKKQKDDCKKPEHYKREERASFTSVVAYCLMKTNKSRNASQGYKDKRLVIYHKGE